MELSYRTSFRTFLFRSKTFAQSLVFGAQMYASLDPNPAVRCRFYTNPVLTNLYSLETKALYTSGIVIVVALLTKTNPIDD